MAERYGMWPGVIALVGDADMACVPCAKQQYGEEAVQAVIDGLPGYERYTDHEGNPLGVVLSGSEDVHGMFCGRCRRPLCDEDCSCYPHEVCLVCGDMWITRYLRNGVCASCRSVMPLLWVE